MFIFRPGKQRQATWKLSKINLDACILCPFVLQLSQQLVFLFCSRFYHFFSAEGEYFLENVFLWFVKNEAVEQIGDCASELYNFIILSNVHALLIVIFSLNFLYRLR